MWIRERECIRPKIFMSHNTTAITTTAFRIDLIDPAIGIKLFTSRAGHPPPLTPSTLGARA
jgi:hypothetical protein